MGSNFEEVLFVGPEKDFGGIGSVLKVYSNNIPHFKFVATYPSPSSNSSANSSSIRFKISRVFFYIKSVFKIAGILLSDRKIKIVHLHSAQRGSFYRKSLISYVSRLCGKKVVFHIHSGNFKDFFDGSNTFVKKFIKHVLKKSNVVICLSKQWQDFFTNELGLTNTTIIVNPIEISKIQGVAKRTGNVVNLLFLGKVCDDKGVFELIDFLKNNRYFQNDQIELVIAGNGEIDRLNQVLQHPQLGKHIQFVGWVRDQAKDKLIADCDIYVLPSYFEGLPVSILEAMAFAKPIISTNVGGIPTIVKENYNGWVIEPVSFAALENIFEQVFSDKTILERYGANSLAEVQKYTPDIVINDLSVLYHFLLEEKRT